MPETPDTSELYRLVKDMSLDQKEHIQMSHDMHEENSKKLQQLNNNQIVANGRTSTNEKAIALLGEQFTAIYKDVDSLKANRWWILGAFAVVAVVGSYLVQKYIEDRVKVILTEYDEIIINK
jgi:hypothetical protein